MNSATGVVVQWDFIYCFFFLMVLMNDHSPNSMHVDIGEMGDWCSSSS